jgi:hypothetical protein
VIVDTYSFVSASAGFSSASLTQQLKDFLQTSTNLTFFWEKIIDRFFLSNDVTHHHTGGILSSHFLCENTMNHTYHDHGGSCRHGRLIAQRKTTHKTLSTVAAAVVPWLPWFQPSRR